MSRKDAKGSHSPERQREILTDDAIHRKWRSSYRSDDVEYVSRLYFRRLVRRLALRPEHKILDAGCGTAFNAVRLAKMGLSVDGVDLSHFAVEQARQYAADNGVADKVQVRQGDLTNLDIPDNSYDAIICIGVLMHVIEFDAVAAEFARILKPGGALLIGETNRHAPVHLLKRLYWRLADRKDIAIEDKPGQTLMWIDDGDKKLFVRQVSLDWVVGRFRDQGLRYWWKTTGDLTELYVSQRIGGRAFFIWLNYMWFKLHGPVRLSSGFYVAFRKPR